MEKTISVNKNPDGKYGLELRPLCGADIPLVEEWLNKEHVKRWYEIPEMGVTIADWSAEIRAYKGEYRWITYLIVLLSGQPVGLCLYYKCTDSVGEDFGSLPLEGAYSIDYMIGEQSCIGKGMGKEMINLLIEKIASLPDAVLVTADADRENRASVGVLTACGFETLEPQKGQFVRLWRTCGGASREIHQEPPCPAR